MELLQYYKDFVDYLLKNEKNPELQKNKFNAVYKIQEGMKNNKNIIWVYFDIETTSNDTNDHNIRNGKIIEIGAFYNENNTFSELCNPSISITNSHIHGITDSMVTDKCTTENTLYNFFVYLNSLKKSHEDIIILIGHNAANFDKKVIENHLKQYKFNNEICENIFIADTLYALKKYVKIKEGNLQAIYKHFFDQSYIEKHRALDDSQDLKKVVDKVIEDNNICLFDFLYKYIYKISY